MSKHDERHKKGHTRREKGRQDSSDRSFAAPTGEQPPKLTRKEYEHDLRHLQEELVQLQNWVVDSGAKVCIVFEGRDTAGKGGSSSASPNGSARGSSAWWRCPLRPSANGARCTSSATWPTSPRPARS